MLTNRELILAAIETTYNQDVSPTGAANAILCEALAASNEGLRMNERPALRSSIGMLKHVYGGSLTALEFTCEIKGSGSAGTAPEIGPLLRACGMSETIAGGTSVTYAPASASHPSVTIYYMQDGLMRKLTGARGNVSFSLEGGTYPKATFRFVGHTYESGTAAAGDASSITLATTASSTDDAYNGQRIKIVQGTGAGQSNSITDYVGSTRAATVGAWPTTTPDNTSVYAIDNGPFDRTLATPTYDSTVPAIVIGQAFTVASYGAVVAAINFDLGNTFAMPPDINSPDGFSQIYITKRDVNGTLDPEQRVIATHDFYNNFRTGAAMALATGLIGTTAGNRMTISMPAISYRDVSEGDRDGVRTLELPFGAAESSGDDEVSIAFT